MKRSVVMLMVAAICGSWVHAGYDYVIETGYGLPSLDDSETLLMTGGGGDGLDMVGYSFARIEGTSPLNEGYGGIWYLNVGGVAYLEFYGGEVHQLAIDYHAAVVLAGGRIDRLWSGQDAWKYAGDPPVLVPNPHITIVCDLDSVNHNTQTNILTGNWLDGTAFNIQLIDVSGYSPAIENIFFTPEPATLLLFGTGVVLLRRKSRAY